LKRATCVLLVIASIATAIWWWSGAGNVARETTHARADQATAASHGQSRPGKPGPLQQASGKAESGTAERNAMPDVRTQFRTSTDYWEFAERNYEAAKRGDGAARYYLSIALEYCRNLYGYYFIEQPSIGRARIRTLDEAQQLTATQEGSGFTPEDVRDIQSRCQRIMNTMPSPFGSSAQWMEAAQAAGYPLALVRGATSKALQGIARPPTEISRSAQSEARALAFDALQSKDPEVVWWLASTAAFLTVDEPGEVHKRQWTWRTAACLREPNCDSMAEWKSLLCEVDMQCHRDDTVMDVIRRGTGNDFNEIERRARELNEKIDAGTVDESDI
jgi:hypothetical protein